MLKVKDLTRVRKGEFFDTPRKLIKELKDKYRDPDERITLEQLLYNEFKMK